MIKKLALGFITALATTLLPAAAFAEGAVKVECWGNCGTVNLGQVCDAYASGSVPVAIACDDTDVGSGTNVTCGNGATCRPWGSMYRSDPLSAYCADSGGMDAIVTCKVPGSTLLLQEPAVPKLDDGAGAHDHK